MIAKKNPVVWDSSFLVCADKFRLGRMRKDDGTKEKTVQF